MYLQYTCIYGIILMKGGMLIDIQRNAKNYRKRWMETCEN